MDNNSFSKIRLLGKEIEVDDSNIENMKDIFITGCYILKNGIYFIADRDKGTEVIKARIDERLAQEVIADGCIEVEYDINNYIHIDLTAVDGKWYTYDILCFDNNRIGIVDKSKVAVYQKLDTREFGKVFFIAAGAKSYVINEKLQLFIVPHNGQNCRTLHVKYGNGTTGLKVRKVNIEEVDWFMGSN